MKWWGKRRRAATSKHSALTIEQLEERNLMAVIPLVSGQTARFQDADGTQVEVRLSGPGTGTLELENGGLTGAAIDSIVLNDTTGESKLRVSTRGGSVSGTTINDLVIQRAINELGALKHLKARKLDFADDGRLSADGGIEDVHVRTVGENTVVNIDGDVGRFKARTLDADAEVGVAGSIAKFVAKFLESGSDVSANAIDLLKIKNQAAGANFDVGAGGLAMAKIKNIYDSSIASEGGIGEIMVQGNVMGTAFASNMDKGSDDVFGTIDDFVVDPSAAGNIGMLHFRGFVGAYGTSGQVDVVTSGHVSAMKMGRSANASGGEPAIWELAASESFPLSVIQDSVSSTGYDDDEIWIAVYGEQLGGANGGNYYYLDPTQLRNGMPVLTSTADIVGDVNTSSPPTLPSFTLADWKNVSNAWGSNLAFPVAPDNAKWSGRILISVGAPMQAQVPVGGSVAAPNPGSVTDPATGTFYDFLEFTVVGATASAPTPSIDIDTSQVDAFGLPMKLQLFKDAAGMHPYDLHFSADISGNVISNVTHLNHYITEEGLQFGQSVLASGILPPGTVIIDYDVPGHKIFLNQSAIAPATGVTFTVEEAGPVGIAADSDIVMGTGPSSLSYFLRNLADNGNEQARPFLQTAAPFLTSGPVQVFGASYDSTHPNEEIVITTTGTNVLQNGDKVTITGVTGNTNANGTHSIKAVTANSFTLDGVTGNATYTGLGTWSLAIEGATTTKAVVTTNTTTGLAQGDTVTISGPDGNSQFRVAEVISGTKFSLGGPIGNAAYTSNTGYWTLPNSQSSPVMGASNAGPIVITTNYTHGLQTGDTVLVSGVGGNTNANGLFTVGTTVTATTFSLDGTTGNAAYTNGGQWQQVHRISDAKHDGQPIEITTNDVTGLALGGVVEIAGVGGNTAANGRFVITDINGMTFTLGSPAGSGDYLTGTTWTSTGGNGTISAATSGGEVVIKAITTGMENGDLVEVQGIDGNPGANGVYYISDVDHTSNTFKLDGSLSGGSYTSGGIWKSYTHFPRLMAPTDVVESLGNPQDESQLNNYYNEVIDDFFVKHAKSGVPVNGGTPGNVEFNLVSSAYVDNTGLAHKLTYSGYVELDPTYNAYALTLKAANTDPTTYKIYYPFYEWNTPADYAPKLNQSQATTPPWINDNKWYNQSASQMVFGCDAFFADNAARLKYDMNATSSVVIADLENSISAAFNRGIVLNDASTWSDNSQWFPENGTYNYWVEYWHQTGIAFNDLAYAFAYDDRFGVSSNLGVTNPGLTQITLGDWSGAGKAVSSLTLDTPSPTFQVQNGEVTLTAHVAGNSPTGTVTFFINGLPINEHNMSNTAPLQRVTVASNTATLTADLPTLNSNPNTLGGAAVYTITAVYSGDANNRPSIARSSLKVNELNVALSPSSGIVGSTTQITSTIPGNTYDGTLTYTISKSDGTNPQAFATSTAASTQSTPVTSNAVPGNVVTFTGNADGSQKIKKISSMVDLKVGQTISGDGLPSGTMITSVGIDSIEVNNPVTAGTAIAFTSDGLGASLLVTVNYTANSGSSYAGFAYFTVT
jgi:hypothetical protein